MTKVVEVSPCTSTVSGFTSSSTDFILERIFVVISKEGLSLLHYREIVVGDNIERLEHLIEHLSVLPVTQTTVLIPSLERKLTNKGTHLYSFRSCTENEHYCFSLLFPLSGILLPCRKSPAIDE